MVNLDLIFFFSLSGIRSIKTKMPVQMTIMEWLTLPVFLVNETSRRVLSCSQTPFVSRRPG